MSNSFFSRLKQTLGLAAGQGASTGASHVHLAIFGKHRGWDDHIPGLGLSQESLVEFKRSLYDGISGNVDNGEWDKLSKAGELEKFGHLLLGPAPEGWIAARCWQSSDGKGRDRYPMVAAALCRDVPLSWVAREAVPALATLQLQCTAAPTSNIVEQLLHESEKALRQVIPPEGVAPDPPPKVNVLTHLADRAEMGEDHQGLLRLIYQVERDMPLSRGKKLLQSRPAQPSAFALRVPPCADTPAAAAQLWLQFLSVYPDKPAVALACIPDHNKWLDLIIGAPTPSLLYGMCAPLAVVPFTTDIPYTLSREFVERVNHFLRATRMNNKSALLSQDWPLPG